MARLLSLHLYPIKSCRGITVDSAQLMSYGLAHDREWMLIHAAGWQAGTFITQRTHPRLAWVVPRLEAEGLSVHLDLGPLSNDVESTVTSTKRTEASAKNAEILAVCSAPLLLPFTFDKPKMPGATDDEAANAASGTAAPSTPSPWKVAVWRDKFTALDAGDVAAHWFSTLLGCAVRMVRFDPEVTRLASATWTKDIAAPTTFADGFPLLVTNQASLDDLNERLAKKGAPPIPMERFRPNVVLSDMEAYEEDYVGDVTFRIDEQDEFGRQDGADTATEKACVVAMHDGNAAGARDASAVEAGSIVLRFVKPCARCPIPTFDQRTGQADAAWPHEPLDTLTTYRHDPRVDGVTFGVNAIVINGIGGRLQRGMMADAEIGFDD